MNNDNVTLLKTLAKNGVEIYIKTLWKQTSFEVWLLAGDVVWKGDCSEVELQRNIKECGETTRDFMNNAKRCLGTSADNHVYDLRLEDKAMEFIWKTKFPDGPSVKCGSLRLSPSEQKTEHIIKLFLDYLIEKNELLTQNFEEVTSVTDNLQTELTKALADLKQITELKTEMEADMYGKFIQLLNSKKKRICVLEQSLQNLNADTGDKLMDLDE